MNIKSGIKKYELIPKPKHDIYLDVTFFSSLTNTVEPHLIPIKFELIHESDGQMNIMGHNRIQSIFYHRTTTPKIRIEFNTKPSENDYDFLNFLNKSLFDNRKNNMTIHRGGELSSISCYGCFASELTLVQPIGDADSVTFMCDNIIIR